MTALMWFAIFGPVIGTVLGIVIGFVSGKAQSAEEVGAMRERCDALETSCKVLRLKLEALAASPPSRRESARVLDRIAPRSTAG
jgi:hypothetical protein